MTTKDDGEELTKLFDQMMAETEGLIPRGFGERVEKDVTGAGHFAVTRRLALAYLEIPWRENVEKVEANRKFAVATAHVAEVLKGHVESYQQLVEWLRIAQTRMWMSLSIREDMDDVIAEARRLPGDAPLWLVVDNTPKPKP